MQKLTKLLQRANWRNSALLTILALLPACTDIEDIIPPAASGAAPITDGSAYPIRRATGTGQDWPSLSTVPTTRPEAPSTLAQQQADQAALEADRDNAAAAVEAVHTPTSSARPASAITIPAQAPTLPPDMLPE